MEWQGVQIRGRRNGTNRNNRGLELFHRLDVLSLWLVRPIRVSSHGFARLERPPTSQELRAGNDYRRGIDSQLRQSGIDELTTVKRAQLEPDGHISVIQVVTDRTAAQARWTPGSACIYRTPQRLTSRVVPPGIA